jgi:hypothetical protein
MATIRELHRAGAVLKMNPRLRPREQEDRLLFASPKFASWARDILPTVLSDRYLSETPAMQVAALFADYGAGHMLTWDWNFKPLNPRPFNTWELKTADIRIFGWFCHQDCFVAHTGDSKFNLKQDRKLYRRHIKETVVFRDSLDLNEPKCIPGDDPNAVLSNWCRPTQHRRR